MNRLLAFTIVLASGFIAACGGGGDNTLLNPGGGAVQVASVEVTASSSTLNSSATGTTKITLQAIVKDAGNAVMADIPVTFQTSSGSVAGTQPITNSKGVAVGELNNGSDPTNRAITVTVTAGGVAGTVTVQVIGTTLSISGPPAVALGDSADYTISLKDSQGAGIQADVTVASANSNTLSATTVQTTTVSGGQAEVTVAADNAGQDTLTVTALGLTGSTTVDISGDIFAIQTPVAAAELALGTPHNVRVLWTKGGVAQNGATITFTSDRGTLSSSTATTDAAGEAMVTISSTSPGLATITAINGDLISTSVTVEFVATQAASLSVNANPLTVGVNRQSTITATVRDATGNAVKNKVVVFNIVQDTTGTSFLSVSADVTDGQGRATTSYTAGSVPSANNGVLISATVQGTPAATDTVALTVNGTAIDMAIGTGDELFEPSSSLYAKEWAVIVTDTTGTAPEVVANTNVQVSIRSRSYYKGRFEIDTSGTADVWAPDYQINCPDEDTNFDGFLDLVTEDTDGDGSLDAGNRATVTALPPGAADDACGTIGGLGGPTTLVQTDENGIARVCVVYVQSDNLWVEARITSLLAVSGTEYSESQNFVLEALASDLTDTTSSPAGYISPFGEAASCADPN